jgi:hypothetical protein
MKPTAQILYRDRLLSRSLLESSPRLFASKRAPFYSAHPAGGQTQSQLHQFKRKLLQDALAETSEAALFKPICGAANQAAEQAWDTSCPLLVFPCLFAELVRQVRGTFPRPTGSPPAGFAT